MKTCRGCPHIALDQWPQGKQAVRCLYTGNGDRFGRVLHVVRAGNPHPDSVRTPEWCSSPAPPYSRLRDLSTRKKGWKILR